MASGDDSCPFVSRSSGSRLVSTAVSTFSSFNSSYHLLRVEPVLYETVSLGHQCHKRPNQGRILHALCTKPSSFFAGFVKNISLSYSSPVLDAIRVLALCEGAVNLGCWLHYDRDGYERTAQQILRLPLQSLMMESDHFTLLSQLPSTTRNCFTHLTRLGLTFWKLEDLKLLPQFNSLPSLNHLALSSYLGISPYVVHPDIIPDILATCQWLRVLTILIPSAKADDLAAAKDVFRGDPRGVALLFVRRWESWDSESLGFGDASDTWKQAEDIVQARIRALE